MTRPFRWPERIPLSSDPPRSPKPRPALRVVGGAE